MSAFLFLYLSKIALSKLKCTRVKCPLSFSQGVERDVVFIGEQEYISTWSYRTYSKYQ